jgi:hypothetical protein
MTDIKSKQKKSTGSNTVLSSRSFWREHTLVAVSECKMLGSGRATLTIGNAYKPILKEITEVEFAVKDNDGDCHYFDWHDYKDYFKVKRVAKKNG